MSLKFYILILASNLIFSVSSIQAKTKVFKFVDEYGRVQFTDRPSHDGFIKLVKTWKGWVEAKPAGNYKVNKKKFATVISNTAELYELPSALVKAIIHAESHYNPIIVSRAGAVGLMQLMPATAQRYKVYDRQNPTQNIRGGVEYFRDLMMMFGNNLDLSLAAYNAGENAVKRYGNKIPPYPETQRYVKKVRSLYTKYKKGTL